MKKAIHWIVRVACLIIAVILCLSGPLPGWTVSALQLNDTEWLPTWLVRGATCWSPLVVINSTLAARVFYLGLIWGIPALVLLVLAIFKGRLFCQWICPVGTLVAIPSNLSLKKRFLKKPISAYVFWISVFSALAGAPLFLLFDPASQFPRLMSLVKGCFTVTSIFPSIILPVLLVLAFFQPMLWCAYLCPLGHLFDLIHKGKKTYPEKFKRDRRALVTGLCVGVPVGIVYSKLVPKVLADRSYPVLPPGADGPDEFASLCHRCYACVGVCPTRVITVPPPDGNQHPGQWFSPQLDTRKNYCDMTCNRCSQVCPSGAIKTLSSEQKLNRQIGIAKVRKEPCMCWGAHVDCMQCASVCPYEAISGVMDQGVECPVVSKEKCRGCGVCQTMCPGEDKQGVAIMVAGVAKQRDLN